MWWTIALITSHLLTCLRRCCLLWLKLASRNPAVVDWFRRTFLFRFFSVVSFFHIPPRPRKTFRSHPQYSVLIPLFFSLIFLNLASFYGWYRSIRRGLPCSWHHGTQTYPITAPPVVLSLIRHTDVTKSRLPWTGNPENGRHSLRPCFWADYCNLRWAWAKTKT